MSDLRNTRATANLDSSPLSNANDNKMRMEEIRRQNGHDNKKYLESFMKKCLMRKQAFYKKL